MGWGCVNKKMGRRAHVQMGTAPNCTVQVWDRFGLTHFGEAVVFTKEGKGCCPFIKL